jgi:hypothetical protein
MSGNPNPLLSYGIKELVCPLFPMEFMKTTKFNLESKHTVGSPSSPVQCSPNPLIFSSNVQQVHQLPNASMHPARRADESSVSPGLVIMMYSALQYKSVPNPVLKLQVNHEALYLILCHCHMCHFSASISYRHLQCRSRWRV